MAEPQKNWTPICRRFIVCIVGHPRPNYINAGSKNLSKFRQYYKHLASIMVGIAAIIWAPVTPATCNLVFKKRTTRGQLCGLYKHKPIDIFRDLR